KCNRLSDSLAKGRRESVVSGTRNISAVQQKEQSRDAALIGCGGMPLFVRLGRVTKIGFYLLNPAGEKCPGLLVRYGRHHDAISPILPVRRSCYLVGCR